MSNAPQLTFSVLTLFPELLRPFTQEALLGKARDKGLLAYRLIDLRDFAGNKHNKVDDTPYGGGAGMVIRVDVVARALEALSAPDVNNPDAENPDADNSAALDEVILLTPAGPRFDQRTAEELARKRHLVLLCGRYEGFDARTEHLVTRELSLGDFVMMGGEAAAACVMEAVGRLVPGVIGDEASHLQDSFSSGLLDYPEYTRPVSWQGEGVPPELLSGNHAAIERWRRDQALGRTLKCRPDLLPQTQLTPLDSATLLELGVSAKQLEFWGAPPPPKVKRKRGK